MKRQWQTWLLLGLLAAGCQLPAATVTPKGKTPPTEKSAAPTPQPSASASVTALSHPFPSVAPSPIASASVAPQKFFGQVLGTDGRPIAGVLVRGFLGTDTGLIGNNGGSIITNGGSNVIGNNGGNYRVLAATLETRTDENGQFKLVSVDGKPLNLEAVYSEELKAYQSEVPSTAENLTMTLMPTGSITGKVTAPEGSTVTNFEGTDVFIPGTSYVAKADAAGNFTISNVAVGTFRLTAMRTGLGQAYANDVKVESKTATTAPPLTLYVDAPSLTAVDPPNGGEGVEVTLTGTHFGATKGDTFQVSLGGVIVASPTRVSDTVIMCTVPATATGAEVFVTVGGIQSNVETFHVIQKVGFSNTTFMHVGQKSRFRYGAYDARDQEIPDPRLTWAVEGTAISVDEEDIVTGEQLGTATLKLSSGKVVTSNAITVTDLPIVENSVGAGLGRMGAVDGVSTEAAFNYPGGIAISQNGALAVADTLNHMLRSVSHTQLEGTTVQASQAVRVAGTGVIGGGDGPGPGATFAKPTGVVFDADFLNVYLFEASGHRIRRFATTGLVSTVAGDGHAGLVNGTGTGARFNQPVAGAFDADGNLFVADSGNHCIRKVTPDGGVTTFAGTGAAGYADGAAGDAQFNTPSGLVFDLAGDLIVVDTMNHRLRKVTPGGAVTTFVGSGLVGLKNGQGTAAQFTEPTAIAIDSTGDFFLADTGNHCIRKITAAGAVTTFAGFGYPGHQDTLGPNALFNRPSGIAVDNLKRLVYVSDTYNGSIRVIRF